MLPLTLSDEQWRKMLPILRAHPNAYVGREHECHRFLSAVLWMARSGAQWRLLPREYGYWNTIYRRFARWSEQGIFHELHQALGRSRGGFSTKIHIAVDALGNPLRLILTAGQRHDSPQAQRLIENFEPL